LTPSLGTSEVAHSLSRKTTEPHHSSSGCPKCVPYLITLEQVQRAHEVKAPRLRTFCESPLTDSNRRPPPYHGGFGASRAYTDDHSRHSFSCKSLILAEDVRREASRVSFLMCPFRVRALVSASTTVSCRNASRSFNEACRRSRCVSVGSAQHRSRSARRPHSCRRDRERNRARA